LVVVAQSSNHGTRPRKQSLLLCATLTDNQRPVLEDQPLMIDSQPLLIDKQLL
jgi:hypothetical protein